MTDPAQQGIANTANADEQTRSVASATSADDGQAGQSGPTEPNSPPTEAQDAAESQAESASDESTNQGPSFSRILFLIVGGFFGLYLLVFLLGLIATLIFPRSAAAYLAYLTDLVDLAMSISTILIVVATAVFVAQLARFVNLLGSELRPLLQDARHAVREVRETVGFVNEHGLQPLVQVQAFFAGLVKFLREISRISRILRNRAEPDDNARNHGADKV